VRKYSVIVHSGSVVLVHNNFLAVSHKHAEMQVESCVHIGGSHWGVSCSSLTGTTWNGGLTIFKAEGTSFTPSYQWQCQDGGVSTVTLSKKDSLLVTGSVSGQVHDDIRLSTEFVASCASCHRGLQWQIG
jgi:hypothetical protein